MSGTAAEGTEAPAGEVQVEGQVQGQPEGGETPPAAQTPPKSPNSSSWADRRIGELTRNWRAEERKRVELEAEVTTLRAARGAQAQAPGQTQPPAQAPGDRLPTREELDAAVESKAAEKATMIAWNQACDAIFNQGLKEIDGFRSAVDNWQKVGGLPNHVIEAAMETEMAPRVIYALAQDLDEASRIRALSPAKAAVAIARFADKLEKGDGSPGETKPRAQPLTPVVGARGTKPAVRLDDDRTSKDDWIKERERQVAEKRKAGMRIR